MGAQKLEFTISAIKRSRDAVQRLAEALRQASEATRAANDALRKPKRVLKKQASWPAWEAGFRYEPGTRL